MLKSFGILNYKSIRDSVAWIDQPSKVNVLIGQNNAGKSVVLKYIAQIASSAALKPTNEDPNFDAPYGEEDKNSYLALPVNKEYGIHIEFDNWNPYLVLHRDGLGISKKPEHLAILKSTNPRQFELLYRKVTGSNSTEDAGRAPVVLAEGLKSKMVPQFIESLDGAAMYIPVERGISVDKKIPGIGSVFSGNTVQTIIEKTKSPPEQHAPKEKKIFNRINRAVSGMFPELKFEIEISSSKEMLIDMEYVRLKYSHYGYGIQQIILMCCAIEHHSNKIVCIDEPENGLHPTLQRRFLKYLVEDVEDDRQIFIATQSPVFADMQSECSLYHIYREANGTSLRAIIDNVHARDMLDDIGIKASDILQANGVIWVEGPSDVILINKWISLLKPKWSEGIEYSFVHYGGSNLAHYTADDDIDSLIQMLKINRHSFVVMDRDRDDADAQLKPHVSRIIEELGLENTWVTGGREIENYIPDALLVEYFDSRRGDCPSMASLPKCDSLTAMCRDGKARIGKEYELDKVNLAQYVSERLTADHLAIHDLTDQMNGLIDRISEWNQQLQEHEETEA